MKNTYLLQLFICFLSLICNAQEYKKVDAVILSYPKKFSSTTKLAKRISADFSTDFDKVRAAYIWIANNVAYDPTEYKEYNFEYSSKEELALQQKKSTEKLAARTLSIKKAVCYGYSTLFKAVCDDLKITCRMVNGCAKTSVNDIEKKYYSNHTWNIVTIQNKNYLIDVTWGAGTYSDHFKKELDYFYFFTDPALFIKSHYPDHYEDALLKEKIERQEFLNEPLYYNFDFKLLQPTDGILKKENNRKILFRFSGDQKVSDVSYESGKKTYKANPIYANNTLEFEIDISQFKKEKSLVIFFDYEPVIAFKLK